MKLYGLTEIAREVGVSRQAIHQQLQRGSLPKPVAQLAMGPVWTEGQVRKWLEGR